MAASEKKRNPAGRHNRLIKFSAYSASSVLAVLTLTAALPPITADQSDRAILDAPVTLITSPIAGEVSAINVRPGDRIEAGALAGEVGNLRVDRTTLMTLQGKADDARQALDAARSKRASDQRYLDALDQQIAAQKQQLLAQLRSQATAYAGELAAANALVGEKTALRDRQLKLVARDVSDPYMLKPTTQQLSSAQGLRDAAAAKLAANAAQTSAVEHDVFVGDNLVGIATLAQKRRDIAFDADRQAIEQHQAAATLADDEALVSAERERIARMTKAELIAPNDTQVLHVGATSGRHVNAGDSLIDLVDCQKLFAVAVFSYRQATNLRTGTRVMISGPDLPKAVEATVSEIIPKSSDTTDSLYALPFPQTERREMYVVVRPTKNDDAFWSKIAAEKGEACPVGRWVTVTRVDGWIPSSSVIWHKAGDAMASLVKDFEAPNAFAQQRANTKH